MFRLGHSFSECDPRGYLSPWQLLLHQDLQSFNIFGGAVPLPDLIEISQQESRNYWTCNHVHVKCIRYFISKEEQKSSEIWLFHTECVRGEGKFSVFNLVDCTAEATEGKCSLNCLSSCFKTELLISDSMESLKPDLDDKWTDTREQS